MLLEDVFSVQMIEPNLSSDDKDEVIEELVELYVSKNPSVDRAKIVSSVFEREEKMSTGIMKNIAVPHARVDSLSGVYGIIGISRTGIDFDSLDGEDVHLFIMLLSSSSGSELHLRVLKRLAILLENPSFYSDILNQTSASDVYRVICKYEENLISE